MIRFSVSSYGHNFLMMSVYKHLAGLFAGERQRGLEVFM